MDIKKSEISSGIMASNGCTAGCKATCTAYQTETSLTNATTKVKGGIKS